MNKDGKNYLKGCFATLTLIVGISFIIGFCSHMRTPTVEDKASEDNAFYVVALKEKVKDLYGISNIDVDVLKLTVNKLPEDANAETGEKYTNLYGGFGEFTYQGKVYKFDFMYNKISDTQFQTIWLQSNYDDSKKINVKLVSD